MYHPVNNTCRCLLVAVHNGQRCCFNDDETSIKITRVRSRVSSGQASRGRRRLVICAIDGIYCMHDCGDECRRELDLSRSRLCSHGDMLPYNGEVRATSIMNSLVLTDEQTFVNRDSVTFELYSRPVSRQGNFQTRSRVFYEVTKVQILI